VRDDGPHQILSCVWRITLDGVGYVIGFIELLIELVTVVLLPIHTVCNLLQHTYESTQPAVSSLIFF
jgi:hypothetical protein